MPPTSRASASSNVIAAQQPFHGTPDLLGSWVPNIGPERASRGWAYGSIRAAGGHIAFGSDWGVVSMDPRIGIHTAVNRTSLDGKPAGGWLPEQKLPMTAVIDAYTSGGAYASFDEQRKGTLAPGMLADIVIMSADIFSTPPESLPRCEGGYDDLRREGRVHADDRPAIDAAYLSGRSVRMMRTTV